MRIFFLVGALFISLVATGCQNTEAPPVDQTQSQREDRAEGRSVMPPPAPGSATPSTRP